MVIATITEHDLKVILLVPAIIAVGLFIIGRR